MSLKPIKTFEFSNYKISVCERQDYLGNFDGHEIVIKRYDEMEDVYFVNFKSVDEAKQAISKLQQAVDYIEQRKM